MYNTLIVLATPLQSPPPKQKADQFPQMSNLRHTTSSCWRSTTSYLHPSLHWYCNLQYPSPFARCRHLPSSRWHNHHHSHSLWTRRLMSTTRCLHPPCLPQVQVNSTCILIVMGYSPSFNPGPTSSSQELLLQGNQSPVQISSIAPTNTVTVPYSSQSHLPSRADQVEQPGDSTPDTVVLNWAASGRFRGPQQRSQPLVYPPPVFRHASSTLVNNRMLNTVRDRYSPPHATTVVCATTVRSTYLHGQLPMHGPLTKETTSCHKA